MIKKPPMQAIDTNILIYAEIESSKRHESALELLKRLAEGTLPWAIPWPCIYEFLRVVTHPRIFHPPVPLEIVLEDLQQVLASPSLVLLTETVRHPSVLDQTIRQAAATGNLIHDAHIAALCLEHGISELITGDRDFSRFAGLKTINPFGESQS
jgi:toxin-antitoxin system PIN domain toxin